MPISLSKFSFELDLTEELEGVPANKRKRVKEKIGKEVLKQIQKDTLRQISPVDGERFDPLSEQYKKQKIKRGRPGVPNLHLKNKMISAIKASNTENGVEFKITQKKIIPRAFNHNTGDTGPQRQFLPDEELFEEFRPAIMKKVERIARKDRDSKVTRELKLRRRSREDLERILLEKLQRDNGQRILREGIPINDIVDEILED